MTATANEEAVGSAAELAAEVVRLRAVIAEGAGEGVKQARARAAELEAHVTKANRVAAAAAKHAAESTKQISGRLEAVEELAARLDKNLQSTKMVLRLREEALGKARKGVGGGDGGGGHEGGGEDEASQTQEIEQLRKMAECPPEVIRMRIEMQQLRARMTHLEAENGVHPVGGGVGAQVELG